MKAHTRIYMVYFGYTIADFIPCEIPECGSVAHDIHHIEARGMGGDPLKKKDKIENLQALCRFHHELYGDKKQYIRMLKKVHAQKMQNR